MKRYNNFQGSTEKKIKVDESYEELWGSDPDIDDIDGCFLQATQICENEDKQNMSQLNNTANTYDDFAQNIKEGTSNDARPYSQLSSTKILNDTVTASTSKKTHNDTAIASTSKKIHIDTAVASTSNFYRSNHANVLDKKVKELQAMYESKEGEVTILRNQIKQTTHLLNTNHARKEQELLDKLNSSKVDLKRVTEELQLKTLEIFNVKRKIENLTRLSSMDANSREKLLSKSVNDLNLESISITTNPLQKTISSSICNIPTKNVYEFTCILKDPNVTDDALLSCKAIHAEKYEEIFNNIGMVLYATTDDLKSKKLKPCIIKLYEFTLEILLKFQDHLVQFEKCIQCETIRKMDLYYLMDTHNLLKGNTCITDPNEWFGGECGIRCRQLLALLSEILIYNTDLTNLITRQQTMEVDDADDDGFLNVILESLKIIGKIRKTNEHSGFLAGVCCLLEKLCQKLEGPDYCSLINEKMCNMTKEIVFARPNSVTMFYLSRVLKDASLHKEFVESLCLKPTQDNLITKKNRGIILFQNNSCILEVFSLIYKDTLAHDDCLNIEINLEKHLNVLKFISNILASNASWTYYQENTHYNCLFELNKLSIVLIHFAFNIYENCEGDLLEEFVRICVKILHELNFKSYEFIERDVKICAQYKLIKDRLITLQTKIKFRDFDDKCLQTLSFVSTEEIPPVDKSQLENLDLW
ncbi:PREDICTED: uncharacterized protein LOC108562513 [Nicrophorus vespilloides]|uniref:Uncharacterized protein LOC108562513 n=1 Tax=Nicrophorus vespilloides TaxID=110193 RepID=A0ABM1MP70_NICVS|nr:PREDICTED: uncharacterized protein LOC108562513 [Nicrophorus vespilloides]